LESNYSQIWQLPNKHTGEARQSHLGTTTKMETPETEDLEKKYIEEIA
jgi:hypothetical protein